LFLFLIFEYNLFYRSTSTGVTFDHIYFKSCQATYTGGVYITNLTTSQLPTFKSCIFIDNTATYTYSGKGNDIFVNYSVSESDWNSKIIDTCTNCLEKCLSDKNSLDLTSLLESVEENGECLYLKCLISPVCEEEKECYYDDEGECGYDICYDITNCNYPCISYETDSCILDICSSFNTENCLTQTDITDIFCKIETINKEIICISDIIPENGCKSYGVSNENCEEDNLCFWDNNIINSNLKCTEVELLSECSLSTTKKECDLASGGNGACKWNESTSSTLKC
jgi:hypothetical protein